MLYVIEFRDDPTKRHVRAEQMDAHLSYLRDNEAKVRVAGSLRKEADDRAVGGLWIVDVAKFEEVKPLYTEDPFFKAGLRASVEVYRLSKAFPAIEKPV